MIEHMLSTIDNPHSPFTDYDEWYAWDRNKGYHTPEFLARIVITSVELNDYDYNLAVELAIDEIVKENVLGLYIKVSQDTGIPYTV